MNAWRRTLCAGCIALCGALGVSSGTTMSGQAPTPFVDVTTQSGLDFVHVNGATGDLLLPEVIGAGGALFDFDNDGDLDLFAVQGGPIGRNVNGAPRSRLFRNDVDPRTGRPLHFTDVTDKSGLTVAGYGMGAATGDYDNDGWVDLYVTGLGSNHLFHNNRDGTFTDVTSKSGTNDPRWSTSATFFDYDRDGWLDLFVANYVNFRTDMKRACFSAASARDYCNPVVYDPVSDRLFHNNRDGTFADVSERAGIMKSPARGLGVMAADLNTDGWVDLYVANDGDPNHLWINQGGSGAFVDDALLSGVAVNRAGQAQGSMGIDSGDVDGDGDEDLFVTNLDNEGNTLYLNTGTGLFEDRTVESGLFRLGLTGFGTRFIDYDNDGWLDLVVANGAVRHLLSQVQKGDPYPLKQRSQLFHNEGRGRYIDVSDSVGPAMAPLVVARGVAAGDLDNDGDIDIVIFNNSGPARVLQNEVGSRRHWLGLRIYQTALHRDALQVRVERLGKPPSIRRVQTGGSYAAAGDPRLVFGLGADTSPQTVRVYWPGSRPEDFDGLVVDRYWVIEEGKGTRR